MRRMPIGIQDFESLIKDGYVYFLFRPRRLGINFDKDTRNIDEVLVG